jgi:GPH family glycoside/pentoside/hexuronide:cation symporter
MILIALFIKEHATPEQTEPLALREMIRVAWQNIPFRYGVAIYVFNWSATDMIIVAFPYFLLYWIAQGDLLAKVRIFGIDLAYKSAFFGILLAVAILSVRFWLWLAQRSNKRDAYMLGMGFWVIVQLLIFTIPQQDLRYLLILAALAGVGVSAAYTLPDSLFSDIIEWDELRTRRRQEGIYFGLRAFIRKVTGAIVIFITLQALGWSGYQQPINDIPQLQPVSALLMIRLLVSPFGALMLSGVIIFTALFPLTRERYERIQKMLERRRERMSKG